MTGRGRDGRPRFGGTPSPPPPPPQGHRIAQSHDGHSRVQWSAEVHKFSSDRPCALWPLPKGSPSGLRWSLSPPLSTQDSLRPWVAGGRSNGGSWTAVDGHPTPVGRSRRALFATVHITLRWVYLRTLPVMIAAIKRPSGKNNNCAEASGIYWQPKKEKRPWQTGAVLALTPTPPPCPTNVLSNEHFRSDCNCFGDRINEVPGSSTERRVQ